MAAHDTGAPALSMRAEPKERHIGEHHLVISQVPIVLYAKKDWRYNRRFFPERNITMCALTDASIIAAIGRSKGTYIRSKAALYQRRPLFLLNNCFSVEGVEWPQRFAKRGAVRAFNYEDILSRLAKLSPAPCPAAHPAAGS
jgi:DNA processing protein